MDRECRGVRPVGEGATKPRERGARVHGRDRLLPRMRGRTGWAEDNASRRFIVVNVSHGDVEVAVSERGQGHRPGGRILVVRTG